MTPKGQEMNDHYYGSIKTRVSEFMKDLNEELWVLGIQAKTEHNEVAPSQHELANNFMTVNVSADQNNLTMEVMKKTAKKHGLECLLHEKPFAGINGSGKHNNWSLKTDSGVNLLDPGETPAENAQFLLFLCAVIAAVDEYQDLIRISITSAGNDHRLGASEAPPAIVSIFVGDELNEILENIQNNTIYESHGRQPFRVNVHTIPSFPKDNTDRNRTSPFAFTGNKFEFRMPGSSASISTPNTILNAVVAEELKHFADALENSSDLDKDIHELIRTTLIEHKRIIFNGNGYDDSWIAEAKKRGLSNYRSTPEALAHYLDEKNVKVFTESGILTEGEMKSRYTIYLERYYKTIAIEERAMADMLRKDILPAITAYTAELKKSLIDMKQLDISLDGTYEQETLNMLTKLQTSIYSRLNEMEERVRNCTEKDELAIAMYYRKNIVPLMEEIRKDADKAEMITARKYWPLPTYRELLFGVD